MKNTLVVIVYLDGAGQGTARQLLAIPVSTCVANAMQVNCRAHLPGCQGTYFHGLASCACITVATLPTVYNKPCCNFGGHRESRFVV